MRSFTAPSLVFICLASLALSPSVLAQQPEAVLSEKLIDRFVETFRPMTEELENLGHDFDETEEEGDLQNFAGSMQNMVNAMMALDGVRDILEKYGWDETFGDTYLAIGMGYSYHMMLKSMDDVPEDQKEMAKPMIDMMTKQITLMVHPDDIELVRPHLPELESIFENHQ